MSGDALRREITAEIIATEVRLERASKPGVTAVLVEGGTDARLFRRFFDPAAVSLFVCFDRQKLEGVLERLTAYGFNGVVGIADPDFDRVLGTLPQSENICWTDANDLESMILPTVLAKILGEYGTAERVEADESATSLSALEVLIREGSRIGAIRLVNKREALALKFEGMTFQFESNTALEIDLDATINHLLARSQCTILAGDLRGIVQAAVDLYGSRLEMCQGHDLIRLLGRGLRKRWGSCSEFDSNGKVDSLEKLLRVAYEREDFVNSGLFHCLRQWEANNAPFRVF